MHKLNPMALPDLNSRQLRAVLAVAEYRSFIAAAAALHMSQPGLTRTIKQIEGTLGVALFSRTTRQVAVTAAGKEFTALAERLLNDLKIGVESMRKLGGQQRGQIIVTSVLSLANAVLPGRIADYSRRFPGVEIHLREGLHNNVRDDVRSGVADFGIGYVEDLPEAFVTEILRMETFHVVFPSQHQLARRRGIAIAALKDEQFVSFPADSRTRRIVDGAATDAGFAFRYAITTNRLATLLGLVRNGVGLAIVPAAERPAADDPDLSSCPLAGAGLSCQLGVMRLRERVLSEPAGGFLVVVKEWLRAQSDRRPGGYARKGRHSGRIPTPFVAAR
jgi:DNA-binding transcriptional LysR family regulator